MTVRGGAACGRTRREILPRADRLSMTRIEDRAVKGIEQFGLQGPLEKWRALRDTIHEEVSREGYNAELGAFVQFQDSDLLDASLLMMPLVEFLPVSNPRVRAPSTRSSAT